MSDDLFFAKALGWDSKLSTARPRWRASATAAITDVRNLQVVTVDVTPCGVVSVDEKRSFNLTLEGRSQHDTHRFEAAAAKAFQRARITQLLVRSTSASGHYVQSPFAFKIEAILELTPRLSVTVVNTSSIQNWVRREDRDFYDLDGNLKGRVGKLRLKVIEAAAFAAMNDTRYYGAGAHE